MQQGFHFKFKQYISANHKSRDFYLQGGKMFYIAREKALLTSSDEISLDSNKNFIEELKNLNQKSQNHNSGIFYRNDREIEMISKHKAVAKFKKIKDERIIWDTVITLSQADAERYKFGSQANWDELIKNEMPKFLKQEGFHINNVEMFYTIHNNTNNPHCHILFYEKQKTIIYKNELGYRKKGKLHLSNRDNFEQSANNFLINRETYKFQNDFKNQLFDLKKDWKMEHKENFEIRASELLQPVYDELSFKKITSFIRLSEDSKKSILNYFNLEMLNQDNIVLKDKFYVFKNFLDENKNNKHILKEKKELDSYIGNQILRDINFKISLTKSQRIFQNENSQLIPTPKMKKFLRTTLEKYDWLNKMRYLQKFKEMNQKIKEQEMKR